MEKIIIQYIFAYFFIGISVFYFAYYIGMIIKAFILGYKEIPMKESTQSKDIMCGLRNIERKRRCQDFI